MLIFAASFGCTESETKDKELNEVFSKQINESYKLLLKKFIKKNGNQTK